MIGAVLVLGVAYLGTLVLFVLVARAGARMIERGHEENRELEVEASRRRAELERAHAEERLRLLRTIGERDHQHATEMAKQAEAHRAFLADHLLAESADRQRLLERVQTPPSWPMLPSLPGAEEAKPDHQIDHEYARSPDARVPWDADLAPLPGDPDHEEAVT